MAGTKIGGAKAAKSNKERYGNDFYAVIGAKGGKKGTTGGFAHDGRTTLEKLRGVPKLAVRAGAKGGRISKRGPAKNKEAL